MGAKEGLSFSPNIRYARHITTKPVAGDKQAERRGQRMKNRQALRLFGALMAFLVLFMSLGQPLEASGYPNDPYFPKQTYLKQIRADQAWNVLKGNTSIKIAVLDSGVDLNHPDLKSNLLPGVNLVTRGALPKDDFGHGTKVTGILAAKGNNRLGVSGVMWNAKVIPIKVLDRRGNTSVNRLVEGIRIATSMGAKVILMSVSHLYHSPELEKAVKEAEQKGVVLVAAAGNNASRVTYPAAYPTVIAVGAVYEKNTPMYQSNNGSELNIMAPGWNLYTTAIGGKYTTFSGTSAAAPQVAAAAALVLGKYPNMTPREVRQLLYHTAYDLNQRGWDSKTGHGLLDVYKALRLSLPSDINEYNNNASSAEAFPIDTEIRGQLSSVDAVDWFYTDIPYEGWLTISPEISSSSRNAIVLTQYQSHNKPVMYYLADETAIAIPVKKGRMQLKLERGPGVKTVNYVLLSKFLIKADRYEKNESLSTARTILLTSRSVIKGNFHQAGDVDWFTFTPKSPGRVQLTVTVDTYRIDTVIQIYKDGRKIGEYDNATGTVPTERVQLEVSRGKYYIRLSDYNRNAVNGEYQLELTFVPYRSGSSLKQLSRPLDSVWRYTDRLLNLGL